MGAKDSSGNSDNILQYIEKTRGGDKPFTVLSGNDSLILWTLLAGGKGFIAGCANVFPHTMVSIYEKFTAGDLEGAQGTGDPVLSVIFLSLATPTPSSKRRSRNRGIR